MVWNGRHRIHNLKYTHYIKHYPLEPMRKKDVLKGGIVFCTKGPPNTFLAANVRKTPTHIIYESENAWNQVVVTKVPLGDVIYVEKIEGSLY